MSSSPGELPENNGAFVQVDSIAIAWSFVAIQVILVIFFSSILKILLQLENCSLSWKMIHVFNPTRRHTMALFFALPISRISQWMFHPTVTRYLRITKGFTGPC
jgi:hypothetical protein